MSNRNDSDKQQGSLILMALLIMLALIVLGTAVISIASMEKKISSYTCRELKAQEAADAGIDWAMEKIYLDLAAGNTSNFDGTSGTATLEAGTEKIDWKIVDYICDFSSLEYNKYTFTSEGTYQGITKKVAVTLVFNKTDINKRSITQYTLVPGT